MSAPWITHVMRAPVVGGSELETLEITRQLAGFRHRVVFPEAYREWQPSIRDRFPAEVEIATVRDLREAVARIDSGLVHLQFPFLLVDEVAGHDTVLELRELPRAPVVFTVHAAVNVPVVAGLHYVFHTDALADRFRDRIPSAAITICPSLVSVPEALPARVDRARVRILWVSRNEDGKFHPEVPRICRAVLDRCPQAEFRFIGESAALRLPADERLVSTPCPAADLAAEYRNADLFWYFPDSRLEETWCRTVTEAMASGLPSVVAAHGAMSEQISDGVHGRVVDSAASCIEALTELVESPRERGDLGARSRSRAAEFQATAIAEWTSLYRDMCPVS